jgi:hypothetical protein
MNILLDCLTLKMKVLRFYETSTIIYSMIHRNVPEDFNLQHHRRENLKCRKTVKTASFFFTVPFSYAVRRVSLKLYGYKTTQV